MNDKSRFDDGAGDGFMIEDWFVPVLYQEREDPALFNRQLPESLQALQTQQRRLVLGELPAEPPHQFVGRSRQLLALERLLLNEAFAVITPARAAPARPRWRSNWRAGWWHHAALNTPHSSVWSIWARFARGAGQHRTAIAAEVFGG
ncbi:MAG: hypothetical protein ACXWTN_04340 [Methylosarcina sp.]